MYQAGQLTVEPIFRFWKKWAGVAVLGYGTVFLFGPALFGVVFGENYQTAGTLAAVIALSFMVQMLSTPTAMTFYVIKKPLIPLCLGLANLLITLICVVLMRKELLPLSDILMVHSLLIVASLLIYNYLMIYFVRQLNSGTP